MPSIVWILVVIGLALILVAISGDWLNRFGNWVRSSRKTWLVFAIIAAALVVLGAVFMIFHPVR